MPDLLSTVRALLIDMDGVVYYAGRTLPGVHAFLAFLRQHHIAHAFATNGTGHRPEDHRRRLAHFGIDDGGAPIITAGMATAEYVRHTAPGAGVYVIGGDGFRTLLQDRAGCRLDDEHPDFVAVGFTDTFDYEKLALACRAIHRGATLLVGDPDVNDPHPDGPTPGSGSFAAAIEAATGTVGIRIGKPAPALYEMALREIGAFPAQAAILGDRLDSDIAGGKAAGICTILTLTGITNREMLERSPLQPDLVVKDLADLQRIWRETLEAARG